MTNSGHIANTANLRSYAQTLADGAEKSEEVKNLVSQADVSDESWGVVGLRVKQEYTTLLNDLNDLLDDLTEGYRAGQDKFMQAADAYEPPESNVVQQLGQLSKDADVDIVQV